MSGFFRRIYDWLLRMFWYATFFLHSFPPFACPVHSVACCKILRSIEKTDCRASRTEQSGDKQEGELRNMASSTHFLPERGQKKGYNNDYEG